MPSLGRIFIYHVLLSIALRVRDNKFSCAVLTFVVDDVRRSMVAAGVRTEILS